MKVKLSWTITSTTVFEKTFDLDSAPATIQRAIEDHFEGESMAFDTELIEVLEIDDEDELGEFENEESAEKEYSCDGRTVDSIVLVAPTAAELGIPGIISLNEVLADEFIGKYTSTTDQALEAGDAYRDAKEVE